MRSNTQLNEFLTVYLTPSTHSSVESFERKLEEAQKNLNIPSKDFIPVIYQDEVDYAAQLISFVPMIAIGGKGESLIGR